MTKRIVLIAALFLGHTATSHAGITFTNTTVDSSGTGFGNILNLLSVQKNPEEFGAVLWNGSSDNETGDAKNSSETRSVAVLAGAGITVADAKFALIFNINQVGNDAGNAVTLHDFTLVFQNAAGGTLFTRTYTAPVAGNTLTMVENGSGSAGYLFEVDIAGDADVISFLGTSTNRLGMQILNTQKITGANDGQENFYLAEIQGNNPNAVPAPPGLLLAAAGALSMGGFGWVRRRFIRRK